jgi:hypothetical protein
LADSVVDLSAAAFTVAEGNEIELKGNVNKVAAVNVNGTLTLSGAATLATSGIITIGSTGKLAVGSSATTFGPQNDIVVQAGGELALATSAVLTLTATKKLTLTGAAGTGGAKLTGAGTLKAGKTEIIGNDGWQAVGGDGSSIEIKTLTENTASITATSSAVLTAGTDATITQTAGTSGNSLTIATGTSIILGNEGSITLGGANSGNPGVILFADTSSGVWVTGLTNKGSAYADAATIGSIAFDAATTATIYNNTGEANGTFTGLEGTVTPNSGLTGNNSNAGDIVIDSTKAVAQ